MFIKWKNNLQNFSINKHFFYFLCRFNKIVATTFSLSVIVINIFLVYLTISDLVSGDLYNIRGFVISIAVLITVFYVIFCLYLLIYLAISMGATRLNRFKVCARSNN